MNGASRAMALSYVLFFLSFSGLGWGEFTGLEFASMGRLNLPFSKYIDTGRWTLGDEGAQNEQR